MRFRWGVALRFAAAAITLYGIQLWVISTAANATPFWDQWDAEANTLFLPLMRGMLHPAALFAGHNEHRILTTRLLALALWKMNGLWNPLLEMACNAVVHVAAILLVVALSWRSLGDRMLAPLLLFGLVVLGLPFAWENIVLGFQVSFYWLLLFSVAALWLASTAAGLSRRYWLAMGAGALAYFSLASGIVCLAAAAVVGAAQFALGADRSRRQLAGVGVLAAASAIGYAFIPHLPQDPAALPWSLGRFSEAAFTLLSWPLPGSAGAALVRNAPLLAFGWAILRRPPAARDPRWFLLALGVWSMGQAVSIAYGRASLGSPLSPRYLDLIAVGLFADFACLLALVEPWRARERRLVTAAGGAWLIAACGGVAFAATMGLDKQPFDGGLQNQLSIWRDIGLSYEFNTRNYLRTGDIRHLQNKPLMRVPYFSAERLAMWLDLPEVRAILPSNLRRGMTPVSVQIQPEDAFAPTGFFPATPTRYDPLFGSYTQKGDRATGTATAWFAGSERPVTVAIPIAGYPLREGMELTVEQNGRIRELRPSRNPHESWALVFVRLDRGPFALHLRDAAPNTWAAIGAPVETGRLDRWLNALLDDGSPASYPSWLAVGLALMVIATIIGTPQPPAPGH